MSRHGVTDEDVRRETEQDDRNFNAAKEAGWCCLYEAVVGVAVLLSLISIPLLLI